MADYGLRVAKKDKSAFSGNLSDIQLSTSFPFAKIDPTKDGTFQTITTTIINDPANNTLVNFHNFEHGYEYEPQVWGLWTVSGPPLAVPSFDNSYGNYISSTGIDGFSLYYDVTSTEIKLYLYKYVGFGPLSLVGVTAKFTVYIFVDDLQVT